MLAQDKADKDVGVLGRDERGNFRVIDMKTSIERIDDARKELIAKMEKAVASGEKVSPPGD